ncbi:MAG: deoxyribonuclease V [Anaerolineae bacterium]
MPRIPASPDWDVEPSRAIALQLELAQQLLFSPMPSPVDTVAGIDVSVKSGRARAAVVVLEYPSLLEIEHATTEGPVTFPYIPGILTFREAPAALEALSMLATDPDVLMFDGQGFAHPRRVGLASHLGLLLSRPSIGCAKSRLCGSFQEPLAERGSTSALVEGDEVIGAVVRTRSRVSPVFVSAGHLIDLTQSIAIVLGTCRGYRLPEPTRRAHLLSNAWTQEP